jgi:hypothetical protein
MAALLIITSLTVGISIGIVSEGNKIRAFWLLFYYVVGFILGTI